MNSFAECNSGATAIEYGLIAGMVSISIVVGLGLAGQEAKSLYESIAAAIALTPSH